MNNFSVHRQRYIIEGFHCKDNITMNNLYDFLIDLSENLDMKILVYPVVVKIPTKDNDDKIAYSSHIIWLESGAQIHTWPEYQFIAVDIFSCKPFDNFKALEIFNKYFQPQMTQVCIPQTI